MGNFTNYGITNYGLPWLKWVDIWILMPEAGSLYSGGSSRADFLNQPFVQLFHQKSQIFEKWLPALAQRDVLGPMFTFLAAKHQLYIQ